MSLRNILRDPAHQVCVVCPPQPTCLNNQLEYVDCQKRTKVQVDSPQRMLRIADPDSRYSGYYSMQKPNNLQADNFYQTAWETGERERERVIERETEPVFGRLNLRGTQTLIQTIEADKAVNPSGQRRDPGKQL